ncbi:FAD-dependent monooxygenase [Aquimarina muelleri]|uniref:FAD-binding domain-containing protein n=1 Tax=Aquimarina muelleri TaxID=279356 RepID=A0A918N430_9FLAO|nr:FAD-dependent monooxygenase [Aquimarina muelleri]MCX2762170.1 FAD-dependent monooxygenase [Aquimarina muelleri]GGX16845.1 hypothetical protein GCM10007384_17990 [Aquimarina muelleri]
MISIIGAGIGGLSLALALEKLNIDYQVFEKTNSIKTVGAGIWLAPNALQILEWLGILESIQSNGNSINRITIATHDLKPLSDSCQQFIKDKFGYCTIAIHRAKLQEILLQNIPNEKIKLGKSLRTFEKLTDDTIKITFEDTSQIETNYLIGADGIHSKVRKQLFPTNIIRYSGQTCWRGVADIEIEDRFKHQGIEMWGNQIRFGISRIASKKTYWFAVITSKSNSNSIFLDVKKYLIDMFSPFHPIVGKLILNTDECNIIKGDINDIQPLKYWYKDNICLIGDAAHCATPDLGQGGAQAIEDAYYLSHLIAQESEISNAYPKFQKKRRKKVNTIVTQSRSIEKIAHLKYGKRLRNLILKNIPKSMSAKKMIELYQIEKNN